MSYKINEKLNRITSKVNDKYKEFILVGYLNAKIKQFNNQTDKRNGEILENIILTTRT